MLRTSQLRALHFSLNIIPVIKSKSLRWAGYVARMGKRRGAYKFLVGKPEGSTPLERRRRRWEDNIKIDFREVGWGHGLDRTLGFYEVRRISCLVVNLLVSQEELCTMKFSLVHFRKFVCPKVQKSTLSCKDDTHARTQLMCVQCLL